MKRHFILGMAVLLIPLQSHLLIEVGTPHGWWRGVAVWPQEKAGVLKGVVEWEATRVDSFQV